MFSALAARRDNSSDKKLTRKQKTAKRVREERADAFRRGINTVLVILIAIAVCFSIYEGWVLMVMPGLNARAAAEGPEYVTAYYYDNSVIYLVPVQRRVDRPSNMSLTALALKELANPPADPSLARIYPSLNPPEVSIHGDEAVVDLPSGIWDHLTDPGRQRALLDAISLTVRDAGECSSMRILMGSQAIDSTPAGFKLSEPISPPAIINLVPDLALDGDSTWVTVWYRDSTDKYFIPLGLEVMSGADKAEESVRRILGDPPQLAYPPPVRVSPLGCSLEKVIIENGVATVDISVTDVMVSFDSTALLKLRTALYLTLKDNCGVSNVRLKLNGKNMESYSRFADIPGEVSSNHWNLEKSMDDNSNSISSMGGQDI